MSVVNEPRPFIYIKAIFLHLTSPLAFASHSITIVDVIKCCTLVSWFLKFLRFPQIIPQLSFC